VAENANAIVYRDLRRADLPTFTQVILLGVGRLERSTGLDQGVEPMVQMLRRPSIWLLLRLSKMLGRPFVRFFVAAAGSRVVGTGTLLMLPNAGYVAGMATDPEYRGRGIASHILTLQHAETARRHRGWLVLDVESENETAIRVYRRAGYREVAAFTWFTRLDLPPSERSPPPGAREATKADLGSVVAKLDAARPPEYRAVLPAHPRMLSHNEILSRGPRARSRTWIATARNGSPIVLRATMMVRARIGIYLPMTGTPEPSPEEVAALFTPATEWLRAQSPATSISIAPQPAGAIGEALTLLGFKAVVGSTAMVRPTAS
jgi:ribosomal protein S18 acetylase RimI-like enzyme